MFPVTVTEITDETDTIKVFRLVATDGTPWPRIRPAHTSM